MLSDKQEQILSYNGEVLIFHLSKAKCGEGTVNKTARLHVRRMVFDSDTKLFVQKSSGQFSMHGGHLGIEMVCCSCTADFRTGINLPCILMKKKGEKSVFKYFLLLLHNSNEFEPCLNFKLDYDLKEDIRIFTGPSVLWRHAQKLFYISPTTCTVLSAPIHFSSIQWTGDIENEGSIVLGVRTVCSPEGGDWQKLCSSDEATWGSKFFGYSLENQKILSGTCFLPHAYSTVVSCVHVCKFKVLKSQFITSVVAVTHKNQLIWFQDGLPKDVCQLPYEEPYLIQIATTSGNNLFFIVSFASGNVCAVWKDSFQVAAKWEKVKSVLVDDFMGTGTEQILLVFGDRTDADILSFFRITDFGVINYSSGISYKEDVLVTAELQENGSLTIQALEARLQAGYTSVQKLQQHLVLKEKVLFESCRALINLVQEREHVLPTAEEEGLVSLWDDTEDPFSSLNKETALGSEDPEQIIENLWQRVVDDSLVIGVQITESLNLSLNDVSLSLVMDQSSTSVSPIRCQNKIVKLNKAFSAMSISSCQTEPPTKKLKLDFHSKNYVKKEYHERSCKVLADGVKTFIAVTQLSPLLAFRNVCCTVLLHAKRRKQQDGILQGNKKITLCGKMSLNLGDISSGKYSINVLNDNNHGKDILALVIGFCIQFLSLFQEVNNWNRLLEKSDKCINGIEILLSTMEDVFAILGVSLKFSFHIISSECTLTLVNMWLQDQMKCTPIKECPENMVCHKLGSLHGTVFNWNLKTPFKGNLTLFCRNKAVLFQCLHSLVNILPPNCKIKYRKLESKDILANQFLLALEKEMVTLRESFSAAESELGDNFISRYEAGKMMNSVTVASLLDNKQTVQQFRKELQSDQKQSTLGMNQTVSGNLYRGIALKMTEAQLNSDIIAWKLHNS